MKKNTNALILFVIILFLPLTVFSTERITNGSFETGDLTGWTAVHPTSAWCNPTWLIRTAGRLCGSTFGDVVPQDGTYVVANNWGSGPSVPTTYSLHQ